MQSQLKKETRVCDPLPVPRVYRRRYTRRIITRITRRLNLGAWQSQGTVLRGHHRSRTFGREATGRRRDAKGRHHPPLSFRDKHHTHPLPASSPPAILFAPQHSGRPHSQRLEDGESRPCIRSRFQRLTAVCFPRWVSRWGVCCIWQACRAAVWMIQVHRFPPPLCGVFGRLPRRGRVCQI
jgi:hypothetical protein